MRYNFHQIFLAFFLFSGSLIAQDCQSDKSSATFAFNECKAFANFPSESDYSEFTADIINTVEAADISVVGDNLYRINPTVNMHSCAAGLDTTAAMCIGSFDDCTFSDNNSKSVRFDIRIDPGADGFGRLSRLDFYEAAVDTFKWLSGSEGLNNYPTLYGLRVTKNGTEVFKMIDIVTTRDFTLESFDFSSNPEFKVDVTTVFNFELLPYCTIGNGAAVNAWDLENLKIISYAYDNLEEGTLTFENGNTEFSTCNMDGEDDNIQVDLSGTVGDSQFIITDTDSLIVEAGVSFPYNVESNTSGDYLIWSISSYGVLTGVEVGNNIADIMGCFVSSSSINVLRSDVPQIAIDNVHTTCGSNNGSAIVTLTGGSGPFTFVWSNGETTANIENLAAGDYEVTVSNGTGCEVSETLTINPSSSPELTLDSTDTSCGEDNGAASVTATSGVAPYTYLWSNGSTTNSINNLPAGTYSVVVTDALNCTEEGSVVVDPSTNPIATIEKNNTSCGEDNGSAEVNTMNGLTPYTYLWSNGATTMNVNSLASGTYTVTVTDAEACTSIAETTIEPSTSPAITLNKTDTSCGENNGIISTSVVDGVAPYTYLWSNGMTSPGLVSLAPGTYTLTVTDDLGCTSSASMTIDDSSNPELTIANTPTSCGDENGQASSSVSSGVGPYTYLWSNGETSVTISDLEAGIYNVTVTDSNGCTATAETSIDDSSSPEVELNKTDTSCGLENGSISSMVSQGIAPYTYAWSNGATSASIMALISGEYRVTVTDSEGCTSSTSVTIESSISPDLAIVKQNTTCGGDNGSATATPSNMTGTVTFAWSNGSTLPTISDLSAGDYIVTATDEAGCTSTATTTIEDSESPTLDVSKTDTSCGEDNGSGSATTTGGAAPYTYIWSTNETASNIQNLAAGTYVVTVTDANGCTDWASVTIESSTSPNVEVESTDSECGNDVGTAVANTTQGTAPYSYAWSNGATSTMLSDLADGDYSVTVTDANGCTTTASTTIDASSAVELSVSGMNTTCGEDNGTASVIASSGVAPYSYTWSNGATTANINDLTAGTYSVVVTDSESCTAMASILVGDSSSPSNELASLPTNCGQNNGTIMTTTSGGVTPYTYAWSNGETTANLNDLEAGDYTLTVTDSEGCTSVATTTIEDSSSPAIMTNVTGTTCGDDNGAIDASVTGGISPYTYTWSNGQTMANISNLEADDYTLVVTDAVGCTAESTVTIDDSSSPEITANKTDTTCGDDDGAIDVSVTGGTAPYTYAWSNGEVTSNLSNLESGDYSLTVTDTEGCTSTIQSSIDDSSKPELMLSSAGTSCGEENGIVSTSVSNGVAPYSFEWSNGATMADLLDLPAGDYTLTVTDAVGCTISATTTIDESISLELTFDANDTSCGEDNGSVMAQVSNGTAPYTYDWSTGATMASMSDLAAGDYTLVVTDAIGCSAESTVTIDDSDPLTLIITPSDARCSFDNGSIITTITSGTQPFTYLWSNGSTNSDLINLGEGTYSVLVTDSRGCTAEMEATIESSERPTVEMTGAHTTCGEQNGFATATPMGGTPPYAYMWDNGETTQTINDLGPGTYFVQVTDSNGCIAAGNIIVDDSQVPTIDIMVVDAECSMENGSAIASATDGVAPYSYSWSNGHNTESITGLDDGTYTVTVTDAGGCSNSATATVETSDAPEGGNLEGGPYAFCKDGTMDMLVDLTLDNESGLNSVFVITDDSGVITYIIGNLNEVNNFDFEAEPIGICKVYHISFDDIVGLQEGLNVADFEGCFDVSNVVEVEKYDLVTSVTTSTATFDMDMCNASVENMENEDYSEFSAVISNDPNCAMIEVVGGNMYRENADNNVHSCTEGANGIALCVSSDYGCTFDSNSDKKLIIDLAISPATTGTTEWTSLTFNEKAPTHYDWIDGTSGLNNYPTKFAIRVFREGTLVYQELDIATQQVWNLRTFEFEGLNFDVRQTTDFTIELSAYCQINNGSIVNAWDIDDLVITTSCEQGIEGGTLSGGPYQFCLDGVPDFITDVTLTNEMASNSKFVLVDSTNTILESFSDLNEFSSYDFEVNGPGNCSLYHIAYQDGFSGCETGNVLKNDFEGCYSLSNAIEIFKENCGTRIAIYPNPTSAMLNVLPGSEDTDGELMIVNSFGQVIYRKILTPDDEQGMQMDLSQYQSGLYRVIVSNRFGVSTESVMLVK